MINKDRNFFQYNSGDLVYIILPLTSLFHGLKQIPRLFCLPTVILMPETLTIGIKAYLQITIINENHSFLSEQLTEDNMKTKDSDNENFLSDQSLHFTLLGQMDSPRLKWFPQLLC